MIISEKSWSAYLERLRRVNDKAASLISQYIQQHDITTKDGHTALLEYVEAVVGKYSEGAAEAACQMYDAIAEASGKVLPAAEPAPTPTFGDVAKTLNGTMKHVTDPDGIGASCARLVKRTGVDTTMRNAIRDGAEWAWVPHGDTCGFCIMLASNGWQKASKKALKGGHAEHIHANCDCTYAIRFDSSTNIKGYNPQHYLDMYYGDAIDEDIREEINAQYGYGSRGARLLGIKKQSERDRGPDFYVGPNKKALEAKYSNWIGESKRDEYLAIGTNPLYLNAINEFYRPGSFIGDGGTSDVRRFEVATGLNCGRNDNNHLQKCQEMLKYLRRKVLPSNLSPDERSVIEHIVNELESVLQL